jgi:ABC-type multidrug transport system fused ATPase/permease subunit
VCVPDAMNQQVLILLAVFVVAAVGTFIRAILFNLSGERFVARLRKNLFASILRQEIGFFDNNRTGELTNRLASDTQVIQNAVTVNISMLARYTLQMILSIGLMFYISPRLTAVLLSIVPVIAVSAVRYGRWLKNLRKDFQDKLAHANSTAEESISNITTVRSFSNELKMTGIYDVDIDKSYHLGRRLAFLSGTFVGIMTFLVFGASALVLWYGGYLVYHSEIAPGTLISLMLYTLNLAMSFAFLSNLYGEFMQAVGASIRIFELMDRESEVKDGHQIPGHFHRGIAFQEVSFSYPSRPEEPVLKSISFEVKPGQVVALVGPSGGGKSTCVRLIEHFYEISDGTILLGQRDVQTLDPSWFRRHIGLVSQEPVLFASSIRDNIAYGKDAATQEEVGGM